MTLRVRSADPRDDDRRAKRGVIGAGKSNGIERAERTEGAMRCGLSKIHFHADVIQPVRFCIRHDCNVDEDSLSKREASASK